VFPLVQFEHGLAGFKQMPLQNPGLFKLHQRTINGRQPYIHMVGQQLLIDIFCRQAASPVSDKT